MSSRGIWVAFSKTASFVDCWWSAVVSSYLYTFYGCAHLYSTTTLNKCLILFYIHSDNALSASLVRLLISCYPSVVRATSTPPQTQLFPVYRSVRPRLTVYVCQESSQESPLLEGHSTNENGEHSISSSLQGKEACWCHWWVTGAVQDEHLLWFVPLQCTMLCT